MHTRNTHVFCLPTHVYPTLPYPSPFTVPVTFRSREQTLCYRLQFSSEPRPHWLTQFEMQNFNGICAVATIVCNTNFAQLATWHLENFILMHIFHIFCGTLASFSQIWRVYFNWYLSKDSPYALSLSIGSTSAAVRNCPSVLCPPISIAIQFSMTQVKTPRPLTAPPFCACVCVCKSHMECVYIM